MYALRVSLLPCFVLPVLSAVCDDPSDGDACDALGDAAALLQTRYNDARSLQNLKSAPKKRREWSRRIENQKPLSPGATVDDRFNWFDGNGDGSIDIHEVQDRLSETITPGHMETFKLADTDGSGTVDKGEFKEATSSCIEGCCATDCKSCIQEVWAAAVTNSSSSVLGGCEWCGNTNTCHHTVDAPMYCGVGINSVGQCWSAVCPRQQGSYLPLRPSSAAEYATRSPIDAMKPLHDFEVYPSGTTGMFDLSSGTPLSDARDGATANGFLIGTVADWGTATCEAKVVGNLMALDKPGMTIHIGDVYYNGEVDEFNQGVAGIAPNANQVGVAWPKGAVTTMLLNGNHEMISGGTGFFEQGFKYSGQQTSYGVWQTDTWRFVALDSGYHSYVLTSKGHRNILRTTDAPQPEAVVAWLRDVVKLGDPEDKRGIVLFSHHQPYDAWSSSFLGTIKQLNDILPAGKEVVWFWGHAHNFAVYDKMLVGNSTFTSDIPFYGRLVGNGGYPVSLGAPKDASHTVFYDDRVYQSIPQSPVTPNYDVHFHGHAKIEVNGPDLLVSYVSAKCKDEGCLFGYNETSGDLVATETFTVDMKTNILKQSYTFVSDKMTKGGAFPKVAASRQPRRLSAEKLTVVRSKPRPNSEECPTTISSSNSAEQSMCTINRTLSKLGFTIPSALTAW